MKESELKRGGDGQTADCERGGRAPAGEQYDCDPVSPGWDSQGVQAAEGLEDLGIGAGEILERKGGIAVKRIPTEPRRGKKGGKDVT